MFTESSQDIELCRKFHILPNEEYEEMEKYFAQVPDPVDPPIYIDPADIDPADVDLPDHDPPDEVALADYNLDDRPIYIDPDDIDPEGIDPDNPPIYIYAN